MTNSNLSYFLASVEAGMETQVLEVFSEAFPFFAGGQLLVVPFHGLSVVRVQLRSPYVPHPLFSEDSVRSG